MEKRYLDEFARRLHEACDANEHVPPLYQGRQTWISEKLGVSKEAVRKYLSGTTRPRPKLMQQLADLVGVSVEWLAYGIEDAPTPKERSENARLADGAEQYISGMIQLLGGTAVYADEADREEGVHLNIITGGRMRQVHIALGDVNGDEVEFLSPVGFRGTVIGVAPVDPEHPIVAVLEPSKLEEHSDVRGVRRVLRAAIRGPALVTAGHEWPGLKSLLGGRAAA